MATEVGAEGAPLSLVALRERLARTPTAWEFFQAVRVLEDIFPERSPVGRFVDPESEAVRFTVPASLAFPPAEIDTVSMPDNGGPATMSVNVMGLIGPLGVLPHQYTLMVAEARRAREGAVAAFLDIFQHRALSLFYRAWRKHRFTVGYQQDGSDRLSEHLRDLVGVGLDSYRNRAGVRDETLVFYVGLLGRQQRSAVALEQLIEDFFDVPAAVQQFVGGLYPLQRHDRCELGDDENPSNRLGGGSVVGDAVWDQQAGVRIRLGPLTRERYDDFLPSGRAYGPLRGLTRFFGHDQYEFEAQLVLDRDEVPPCVLTSDAESPQGLGWSTWIRSRPFTREPDETILKL
ncbi:MAG TPA: type VI secretion system baseplate subunit TssG [Longimicrobiales bacterium]|nr:type VI secretion system baseplate subunit TssG [Longimicrobiales bacterium]